MRHRNKTKKLGRTSSHRKAIFRNIAKGILENHQVKTTVTKAKAARGVVDRLITYGKKDTVAARRLAFKILQNHQLIKVLFDEIAPTFAERSGGYTRVIKLGRRRGDGAELAVLQLVGFEPLIIDEKKSSAKKKTTKKKETAKEGADKKAKSAKKKKAEPKPEKSEPAAVEEKVETRKKSAATEKQGKPKKAKTDKPKAETATAPAKKTPAKKSAVAKKTELKDSVKKKDEE